jgi:hypothetical protein
MQSQVQVRYYEDDTITLLLGELLVEVQGLVSVLKGTLCEVQSPADWLQRVHEYPGSGYTTLPHIIYQGQVYYLLQVLGKQKQPF